LKDHIVGLNCGRWDYISLTSKFRNHPNFVVPNRDQVTMTSLWMLIQNWLFNVAIKRYSSNRRMAAQIPIKMMKKRMQLL
jgi:malate synthase